LTLALLAAPVEPNNPILQGLTQQGVKLTTGESVKLPEPSMPDGLDAAGQQIVLRKIVGGTPLELFLRKSPVAPLVLKMETIKGSSGQRNGQRVDLWFVVYGTLQSIRDEKLFEGVAAESKEKSKLPSGARELTAEELQQRNLAVSSAADAREGFSTFEVSILDRVQVSGVARLFETRSDRWLLVATKFDPRFDKDPALPNRWRPIERDPSGKLTVGEPQPYSGYGGYAKATVLLDPAGKPSGSLLIECHVVFDEPKGWFRGANLLRSKLPPAVQDGVRTFRRKLAGGKPKP
jgi:hypothetical protein